MKVRLAPLLFEELNERERREYEEHMRLLEEIYGDVAAFLPATTVGDPIIKVVFDKNGHPSVQSRELAAGRDDVTFDVLATKDLADWGSAKRVTMKLCDDGLWKPVESEDPNYVFPEKMFYKYLINVNQ